MSLVDAVNAQLILRERRRKGLNLTAPKQWDVWCKTLLPEYFSTEFAPRHQEYWEWIEAIRPGIKPQAFIGVWGRGGAKSTNAEGGIAYLGAKKRRRFALYVSGTQVKADSHVDSISSMLEKPRFGKFYSKMSVRAVNKYGASKGWRHNRLHTSSGFVVAAFGLDAGLRGIKVEDARPDLIVIDDVDELHESIPVILKKMQVITDSILPAGSSDCAILAIQNLISPDSIFSRLLDGRADFLRNRIVSGPHPAVENMSYHQEDDGRFVIDGGKATWAGQSLEICQTQVDDWGISAFLRESQHEVEKTGGRWSHINFVHVQYESIVPLVKNVEFWVDPAVTSTDMSDCQGISGGAELTDGRLANIYSWEGIDTPENALMRAIEMGIRYGASFVGVETDQGGDLWADAYKHALEKVLLKLKKIWREENPTTKESEMPVVLPPKFKKDKAGSGHGSKTHRNERMMADYENGKVIHCIGTSVILEKALYRFDNPPLDLADSWYYCWWHLIGKKKSQLYVRVA